MKEAPSGELSPGKPFESFPQRDDEADQEDADQRVTGDLFDKIITP